MSASGRPGPRARVLHEDELPIKTDMVRALVDRDLPARSRDPLRPLASSGSSNALFRLGDDMLVRLPRQPGGSATIDKEARWLPVVGPALPVAVPGVVHVGQPGFGYPERWSVVTWIDGQVPVPLDGGVELPDLAADLARVLTALRGLDVPADARTDPVLRWYRAEPLAARDVDFRDDVAACRAIEGLDLDLDAAVALWDEAMALPGVAKSVEPRWLHADLLAENLLVRDGRLAAVLDFGALSVGDPTVDLVVAWELLDPSSRAILRRMVGADEATWLRGRAWALCLAMMTFPYYWHTMPRRCADRLVLARAVLADATA